MTTAPLLDRWYDVCQTSPHGNVHAFTILQDLSRLLNDGQVAVVATLLDAMDVQHLSATAKLASLRVSVDHRSQIPCWDATVERVAHALARMGKDPAALMRELLPDNDGAQARES